MSKHELALSIVDKIIADLSDRRGLKQEWYQIDDDVQEEIRQTWATFIETKL